MRVYKYIKRRWSRNGDWRNKVFVRSGKEDGEDLEGKEWIDLLSK